MRHIVETQQFDRDSLQHIFNIADSTERTASTPLRGKILASLFYEPSTRTRLSFESAMLRLGGSVIGTENADAFSSAVKGETLEDSIRAIGNYADVIVLRHHEEGASRRAADVASVPIINAGDGMGQHPTQSLLDVYTIKRECGYIDGLEIAIVGDLKHNRTGRSLAYMLGKYDIRKLYLVAPEVAQMASDVKTYLDRHQTPYEEYDALSALPPTIDVVYQNRVKKEYFESADDYERAQGKCVIDRAFVSRLKPTARVLHALPRNNELPPEVDHDPRAAYFRQVHYGLLIRMALLSHVLAAD